MALIWVRSRPDVNAPVITAIDIRKYRVPFPEPIEFALGRITHSATVFVRIHADNGLYGMGEASPDPWITGETQDICFTAAHYLAPNLLGKAPTAVADRTSEINALLLHNSSARCAFDLALYDLAAKQAGLPLYAYLGGGKRSFITNFTLWLDTPERTAEAARAYQQAGAVALKVKVGTSREEDVARVQAVRAAVGPEMPLRIDANQGWNEATAIATLHDLAPLDIEFCEQPVLYRDFEALARVRTASPIPIMADESLLDQHDAARLAAIGACDLFNIKPGKAGGLHNALEIEAIARRAGIPCMVGVFDETRLALSAYAHFICARPNILYADLDSYLAYPDDPISGGAIFDGPHVRVSDEPGHGADVRAEVWAELEGVTIRD